MRVPQTRSSTDASRGVDTVAMRSSHFQIPGSRRTYWDSHVGSGLVVSVFVLLAAVVAWQLGSLPAEAPLLRATAWALVLCFAAVSVLSWVDFFTIPLVFSARIAVCLLAASWRSSGAALT